MKALSRVQICSSILGLLTLAGQASAAESHTPLHRVEGLLIHNSATVSSFDLEEGRYVSCERTTPSLNGARCVLENGELTITREDGQQTKLPINGMSYFETTHQGQVVNRHYMYRGKWTIEANARKLESEMTLTIIRTPNNGNRAVQGYISVSDLNISEQVRGFIKD